MFIVVDTNGTFAEEFDHLRDAEAHVLEHDLDCWIENTETGKEKHFNAQIHEREKKDIEYEITQTMLGFPSDDDGEDGWK